MKYLSTAVLTVLFTDLFLVVYKLVINPQMVITPTLKMMSKCPNNWTYNGDTKMCVPQYDTKCTPFDPDAPTLNTVASRCNVANMCGTDWSGVCA